MKNILSLLLIFLFAATAFSQQDNYRWRVGVTGGAMTYYGDLSTQIINIQSPWLDLTNNLDHVSYGINIENNFSPSWGWRLSASQGRFQATDRVINWANEVQLTPNTNRSLNVQTDISNVFFSFNYYTDNEALFGSKARISPYFNFGIGLTRFTPYADLLGSDDQIYYYWSDLTIRDAPEMSVPPAGAAIIQQDGIFETNLRNIQTEGITYNTTTLSFPVGVGLKFRVSDRININLEAQGVYTLTDYLDDVSGKYITNSTDNFQNYASNPNNSSDVFRGNPEGLKDIYGYISLGLYYNFGYKTETFLPPVFFTKDGSFDKKPTQSDTTITKISVEIVENGGLKTIEDEDIVIINTPDTIQKIVKKEIITTTNDINIIKDTVISLKINNTVVGQQVVVEKIDTVISPIKVEKPIKIDTVISPIKVEKPIVQKPIVVEKIDTVISPIKVEKPIVQKPIVIEKIDTVISPIKVEKPIVQKPIVIEKIDTVISPIKVEKPIVQKPIVATEKKKEVVTNDIEVINLDGSPARDTIQKIVKTPKIAAPVVIRDTINKTTIIKNVVISSDTIIKKQPVLVQQKEKPVVAPITKTDTLYIKTANPTSIKLLEEVETSRLELAQLQQKYNTAITKSDKNKVEMAALQSQLDSMQLLFKNYQQYNNNVAIRANDDFSKPENQAIATATEEMAKEMAYLKTQLDLSDSNYKKAYENAQINQQKSQKKIKALEAKVSELKEEAKNERRSKRNPIKIINESRVKQPKTDDVALDSSAIEVKDSISVDSITINSSLPLKDSTATNLNPIKTDSVKVVEGSIFKKNTVKIAANPSSETIIQSKVDSIAKALELKQAITLAEKKAEVNELNQRLAALETQLQSVKKEENDSVQTLQGQLETLTKELNELKKKPTPKVIVTAPKPKPIDLKEVIKGYEATNVYFNVGKSTFGIEYENKLQKVASLMLLHPELNAVITGYTDKSGNPDVNLRLSKKRANNVKTYLMQQGIQSNRLQTGFQGSSNATKANDPLARRVEILLIVSK